MPAPSPAFIKNSRRSRFSVIRSSSNRSAGRGTGKALSDLEPLHGHGVRGAADGAEAAADTAVVVLDHRRQGKRVGLGPRGQRFTLRLGKVQLFERHEGQTVLGTDLHPPLTDDAFLDRKSV